jgi:hypothetical protein
MACLALAMPIELFRILKLGGGAWAACEPLSSAKLSPIVGNNMKEFFTNTSTRMQKILPQLLLRPCG